MVYINDSLIEQFIKEDVPYIGLTTLLMGIKNSSSKAEYDTYCCWRHK